MRVYNVEEYESTVAMVDLTQSFSFFNFTISYGSLLLHVIIINYFFKNIQFINWIKKYLTNSSKMNKLYIYYSLRSQM